MKAMGGEILYPCTYFFPASLVVGVYVLPLSHFLVPPSLFPGPFLSSSVGMYHPFPSGNVPPLSQFPGALFPGTLFHSPLLSSLVSMYHSTTLFPSRHPWLPLPWSVVHTHWKRVVHTPKERGWSGKRVIYISTRGEGGTYSPGRGW